MKGVRLLLSDEMAEKVIKTFRSRQLDSNAGVDVLLMSKIVEQLQLHLVGNLHIVRRPNYPYPHPIGERKYHSTNVYNMATTIYQDVEDKGDALTKRQLGYYLEVLYQIYNPSPFLNQATMHGIITVSSKKDYIFNRDWKPKNYPNRRRGE